MHALDEHWRLVGERRRSPAPAAPVRIRQVDALGRTRGSLQLARRLAAGGDERLVVVGAGTGVGGAARNGRIRIEGDGFGLFAALRACLA